MSYVPIRSASTGGRSLPTARSRSCCAGTSDHKQVGRKPSSPLGPEGLRRLSAVCRRSLVALCCRVVFRPAGGRLPQGIRPDGALRREYWAGDPHGMGALDEKPRRLDGGQSRCPHCGLLGDWVATLEHDWVLLEPDMRPLAHTVPADRRWIELSDGRVTVYGVCPPDPFQRCRIAHDLACPAQTLPDLWPWLTSLRIENARRVERGDDPEPPPSSEPWPDAG
ncbi:DUF6083 domain-containing protein [Streptomyces werraensis]|uniref:DUF6083 domain-containing protein n=1 Tax=Streptomyces werraensis TaxID=68284 RepID=UPI0037D91984